MTSPVKSIRKRLLLTQEDLATYLGISRQMVWAYETGKSMPRFETIKSLMKLAKDFGIEINAEDFFI